MERSVKRVRLVGKEETTELVVVDTNVNYKSHIINAKLYTDEGVIVLDEAVVNQLYAQICDAHFFIEQDRKALKC